MDFERLFKDYRVPYSLRINKGWVNANCPYCDKKIDSFNMGFNPKDDYCNCWKCGSHDLAETLSMLIHVPVKDIGQVAKAYQGTGGISVASNQKKLYKGFLTLPGEGFTLAERKYLEKRSFDADYLHEKYGVVGGGITGKWKFRIIIPLYYKGKLASWTARSILSKKELKELNIPRYKNLSADESAVNPKDLLFNLDNANGDEVVLTEGPFDVMRFGDGFVCSLGTQLTQNQIKLLVEKYKKVYIMFDNEEEAWKKAHKYAVQIASMGLDVEVVDAYSDFGVNDGGDCNEEQVALIRKELGF